LVKTGDLIVGYANSRGDPAGAYRVEEPLFDCQYNGTFLVVRKIGQDREALDNFVCVTKAAYPDLDDDDITAALVGRSRDGKPLITAAGGGQNDFDYEHDRGGDQCPLASHIRRANPRVPFQGRPAPRILRRGMSYGPAYVSGENPQKPRGIMFMACCASIAEQYEVIQRWLNGGNSTRLPSAQNDPLTGISRDSQPRTFRFFSGDMARPDRLRRASIPHPSFTKLEWGAYFFFPAHAALRELAKATCETLAPVPNVKTGNQLIEELARLPEPAREAEWKRLLEDFLSKDPAELAESPDVWGAIRSTEEGGHHGIYRVPGPIASDFFDAPESARRRKPSVFLVGSRRLIDKVFASRASDGKIAFSSEEQYERLDTSGIINYVAMDPGKTYREEARETNEIVWDVSQDHADQAFLAGYGCAEGVLNGIKRTVASLPVPPKSFKIDLGREFLMPALGLLTNGWFGIPDALSPADAGEFELGEWGWKKPSTTGAPGPGERRPRCPGDFLATSRYAFYPRPGPEIIAKGIEHGEAIRAASLRLVERWYQNQRFPGVLTSEIAAKIVQTGAEAELDLLARNVIGNMIGMLPPMNGALRGILHEWLKEKTLWQYQAGWRRARLRLKPGERWPSWRLARDELGEPISRAMCRRPAPDLLYRTVVRKTRLGHYHLVPGDFLILGLISATQEELEQGKFDVLPIFGGERYAAIQPRGAPFHACPAREMSMAAIEGILAALLDSGQIKAQAASLIVEIGGYPPPPP
jgi:hypothetical protein